jgi:hypothetical protein
MITIRRNEFSDSLYIAANFEVLLTDISQVLWKEPTSKATAEVVLTISSR